VGAIGGGHGVHVGQWDGKKRGGQDPMRGAAFAGVQSGMPDLGCRLALSWPCRLDLDRTGLAAASISPALGVTACCAPTVCTTLLICR
jgi:hypothetical protein